jgi:hypothetical protein
VFGSWGEPLPDAGPGKLVFDRAPGHKSKLGWQKGKKKDGRDLRSATHLKGGGDFKFGDRQSVIGDQMVCSMADKYRANVTEA